MHLLRVRGAGPSALVLRRMLRRPWSERAGDLLGREANALSLLAGTAVPAPALVAVDPAGAATDAPALLMSHLPGRVRMRADRRTLDALAGTLVAIHRLEPPADRRPPAYESWVGPAQRHVPDWATDAAPWERALAIVAAGEPDHVPGLLHRDYHPGNVLFGGDGVTGVVDWVESSWGPAELDVAHCQTNLALLHGPSAADDFRSAYLAAGGRLAQAGAARAYWELIDAIAFVPELAPEASRRRLERHVQAIVARAC
jgi:aminoglycoside phosphotransferase (APT) family kinase protein